MTVQALEELVRQAERVIDAQLRTTHEGDARSRHWMATTMAAYGAAAAVAALAGRLLSGWPVWPAVGLLALSVGLGGRAFTMFAHAYGGDRLDEAKLAVGWDAGRLADAVQRDVSYGEVLEATVRASEGWIHENSKQQRHASRLRRRGQYWLLSAAAALAAALIYSLGVNGT